MLKVRTPGDRPRVCATAMAWTAAEISSSPPTRTTWNGELLCLWMLNTAQDCLIPRLLCVGRQNPNTPPLHKSLETRLGSRGYSQPLSHTKPPPSPHTHTHLPLSLYCSKEGLEGLHPSPLPVHTHRNLLLSVQPHQHCLAPRRTLLHTPHSASLHIPLMCHHTFTNHLQMKLKSPSGSPCCCTIHLNSQRWVTPCQSRWLVQESRTSWTMGLLLRSSPLPQTKDRQRDDIIVHWWWHQSLTHPGSGGQADHAAVL